MVLIKIGLGEGSWVGGTFGVDWYVGRFVGHDFYFYFVF